MAHTSLNAIISIFDNHLNRSVKFAFTAYRWYSHPKSFRANGPRFTLVHRDALIEAAFLHAFIAWETFLEESFILYACGKKLPRQKNPHRLATIHTREQVEVFVIPVGKDFSDWAKVSYVTGLAERFFKNGKPYTDVLKSHQVKLDDMRFIRNAIAHSSKFSQEKFQNIVRNQFGTLPPRITIGSFLISAIPHSSPPTTFLENYFSYLRLMAQQIIPI